MFNITKIDQNLNQMDHLSLRDLADFFENQAEMCREHAHKNALTTDEQQSGAIDFLMRTPRIVMRYLRAGCTLDEALQKTAECTHAPIGSIQRAWRRFLADKSTYELRRRNRLILELASMGFKNADIGRKLGLHPNSVSRIIGQARRAYHTHRADYLLNDESVIF